MYTISLCATTEFFFSNAVLICRVPHGLFLSFTLLSNLPRVSLYPKCSHISAICLWIVFHQYSHIFWSIFSRGHSKPSCSELLNSCCNFSSTEPENRPWLLLGTWCVVGGRNPPPSFLGLLYLFLPRLYPHLTKHTLCKPQCLGGLFLNSYMSVKCLYSVLVLEEGWPGHKTLG